MDFANNNQFSVTGDDVSRITANEFSLHEWREALSRDRAPVDHVSQLARKRLDHLRRWIRIKPLPALGVALCAGFVAGRLGKE